MKMSKLGGHMKGNIVAVVAGVIIMVLVVISTGSHSKQDTFIFVAGVAVFIFTILVVIPTIHYFVAVLVERVHKSIMRRRAERRSGRRKASAEDVDDR